MGYYGYDIDPEELEKEKRASRKEKEREECEQSDEELVGVSCSQCECEPGTCDRNCVEHLSEEYLASLIGGEQCDGVESNDVCEEDSSLLSGIKKKALCLEPGLLERLKGDLSKEDYAFIKRDMIWYTAIFFLAFAFGIVFLLIGMEFNLKSMFFLSILAFFSQKVSNFCWKGRYWNYVRSCTSSRRRKVSYHSILKEIPMYRSGNLDIPRKKIDLVVYGAIFVFGVLSFAI